MTEKVWGLRPTGGSRVIVRARSQSQAIELLGQAGYRVSRRHFSQFAGLTANDQELATAVRPGVWQEVKPHSHQYREVAAS